MKSVLLYNLYPKGNWKQITKLILNDVPYHETIIVNINLDKRDRFWKKHLFVLRYLKQFKKIKNITYSLNNPKLGEVVGFDIMRQQIDYNYFDIVTYTHSKGVTRPQNIYVKDWVKMMKYFVIDRHDLCIKAFENNFALYGTRLAKYDYDRIRQYTYKYCDYWYAGTFVSVNLKMIKKEFISINCPENYYGVEAFFGLLCDYKQMYNVHQTPYSLYDNPYPEEKYKL